MKRQLNHLAQNLFVGDHSTTIVLGFTVGGALLGRSIWQYLFDSIGLFNTTLLSFLIFVSSGFYMHKFYDDPADQEKQIEQL